MYHLIKNIIEKEERIAAGIMSGTSFDGIDVILCKIRGSGKNLQIRQLYFETFSFTNKEKADLLMVSAKDTSDVSEICRINKELGIKIGNSILSASKNSGISLEEIDFISSHGQTVHHMPEIGATLQIGELSDIAAVTGKITVGDFRPSDMAYGGQGAPLVPFMDYILYSSDTINRVLFNIGGMGNVTILGKNCGIDGVTAFDTGPGNVNIDNLMRLRSKGEKVYDEGGKIAASGKINNNFMNFLADIDIFLKLKPPKSTGRELYTLSYADKILKYGEKSGLSFPDILACATNHTAYALKYSLENYNSIEVDEILVSGGGAKNDFLMECIKKLYPNKVKTFSDDGISSDAKEAAAFAILGNEFLCGKFNNIKSSTGANKNVIMGKLALPSKGD